MTRTADSDSCKPTVQTRPWLLPDLLDRHLYALEKIETKLATGEFYGGTLEGAAEYMAGCYQANLRCILDRAHPLKWCAALRPLLHVEGAKLAAMKRRAKAAGAPPPQFELMVSIQIMEALMRGHVLAAASEMTSTTTRATTMASWSASPTYPPESTSRIRACDAGISSEGVRRTITLASGGRRVALTERSLVPRDHGPSVLPAVPDLRRLRDAETSDTPERPTIAEMIDRYLAWKAGKAAENTVKTYTAGLKW